MLLTDSTSKLLNLENVTITSIENIAVSLTRGISLTVCIR